MPRPYDEYKSHHLPDVSEESEYDLWSDRFSSWIGRSSKSRSPDSFKFSRRSLSQDRKSSSGVSSSSPDFYEATGRRSSSDNGNDLTTDTDSFMIGNRVYVGGVKSGRITFIGEVHFAPGEWAGVVLDEPEGKNDGAVSGKRYFQCEPKKGIFSRLTRLTREPLGSAALSDGTYSMETSFRSMTSPARSGTTSPTYSMSSAAKSPLGTRISSDLEVNDRVIVKSATGSRVGVLRYIGTPLFASGVWCGVEFDEPVGKNDGTVSNHRYFKCAPNHGLFVPQSKVSLSPLARKNRLSRANSQESLASNLTLGSSTTTSKLRSDAIQKRMSLHKTSTAATSTPKPLYSLQDILREKTNHIEQLMNEREKDRDEMAAQGVLFNKNISLYKDQVKRLQKELDEERKKSEDLQFSFDEAAISAEESTTSIKTFKEKIARLENALRLAQGGGDQASAGIESKENTEILNQKLNEISIQLQTSEDEKKILEKEIKTLNENLVEIQKKFELKSSSASDDEKRLKDNVSALERNIEELKAELSSQKEEKRKFEEFKDEQVKKLDDEMKNKLKEAQDMTEKLKLEVSGKNEEVEKLKKDIENLTSSDAGTQEVIKQKDLEIQRLIDESLSKNTQITQFEAKLQEHTTMMKEKEAFFENLQKSFADEEMKFQNLIQEAKKEAEELTKQTQSRNDQNQKIIDEMTNMLSTLNSEIEQLRAMKVKADDEEKNSKQTIDELVASKVKLETEITTKETEIKNFGEKIDKLEKEVSERDKCMAGLEMEVSTYTSTLKLKEAQIDLLKGDIEKMNKEKDDDNKKNESNVTFLTELKVSLDEKIKFKENEIENLTMKLSQVERDDAEKASRIEKIEASLALLGNKLLETEVISKNLLDDKNKLEVDRNDLTRKLGAHEEKINQLLEQKTKLQNDLETTNSSSLDINSELLKLNNELKEKQAAFESYQQQAENAKLLLERQVDELQRQNGLLEQQIEKIKSEMDILQAQKIESENQLNQELQNIKLTSDEEKLELRQTLTNLRNDNENEKARLTREKQQLIEAFEKTKEEMESKIRNMEMDSKSSIEILSKESDEKLSLHQQEIVKVNEELKKTHEQLKLTASGTEEKIKILDDIQQKCYDQEQKINDLNNLLENEKALKKKLEDSLEESRQKFRELEDEQVDVVNKKQEFKVELENLQQKISEMSQSHESFHEQSKLEKKNSELQRATLEQKFQEMDAKIIELLREKAKKDQENVETTEKLHLREQEVTKLHDAISTMHLKLKKNEEETQKVLKGKDEELLKAVHESSTNANLVADLQNNLDNFKALLNSTSNEKKSLSSEVEKLNETISVRDFAINELENKVYQIESQSKEIQNQLKNIESSRGIEKNESEMKIKDLMEKLRLIESSTEKEVSKLTLQLNVSQNQMKSVEDQTRSSIEGIKEWQKRENELTFKIKELEIREAELELSNQGLKRKYEDLEKSKEVPSNNQPHSQEMVEHIEFLNGIISDMHKKNLKLTEKVELLLAGSSKSSHNFSLDFLDKKKPAPRLYCDICEMFDAHDTEDCPQQCSEMDLPTQKEKKPKMPGLPTPRTYCDLCEEFDQHDTADCPNADDETF